MPWAEKNVVEIPKRLNTKYVIRQIFIIFKSINENIYPFFRICRNYNSICCCNPPNPFYNLIILISYPLKVIKLSCKFKLTGEFSFFNEMSFLKVLSRPKQILLAFSHDPTELWILRSQILLMVLHWHLSRNWNILILAQNLLEFFQKLSFI